MKLYKVDAGFYGDAVELTIYEVEEKPKTFITIGGMWTTRFKKNDLDRIINSSILFTNKDDIMKNKIRLIDFKILSSKAQTKNAKDRIELLSRKILEYKKLRKEIIEEETK